MESRREDRRAVRRASTIVVAANYFTTDGYRDHSEALAPDRQREAPLDPSPDTRVTVVGNALYQPEAQDPLGLTRAQWEANPRQADPAAMLFDTRKTVNQRQAGVTVVQRISDTSEIRVTGYAGTRTVRQFLALPGTRRDVVGRREPTSTAASAASTAAGSRTPLCGDRPGTFTLGGDYETQQDQRKGFVNNNGDARAICGATKRQRVQRRRLRAARVVAPSDALSILAGYRYSDVHFESDDHYIVPGNPDDSGQRNYSTRSPIVGAVWHATDRLNVYASYGQGFETPTFIELAYRPVGSGLNLALQPSVSNSAEVGMKAIIGRTQRVNLAVFDVKTTNEIVIDTATGGRTTYKNASETERKRRRGGVAGRSRLRVRAATRRTPTCPRNSPSRPRRALPPQIVPAGARLPGVPRKQRVRRAVAGRIRRLGVLTPRPRSQYAGEVYVNDRNTDFAPPWTIANVRVGFEQRLGSWISASSPGSTTSPT